MKYGIKLIRLFSLPALCLLIFSAAKSQEMITPLKQNLKIIVTPTGDASFSVTMTLNASQWDNFKKFVGGNPDILKRSMERSMPGYFLQNFNYKEDVMNRGYTLSFDALGIAKINAKGLWQIDLDMKNPDITKLSDRNYVMTANMSMDGALVQQISNVTFPSDASDIKQSKDAFEKANFTYKLDPGGMGGGIGWWVAIVVLLALGGFLLVRGGGGAAKPAMAR